MCQVLPLAPRGSVALYQNGSTRREEIQLVHIKCDRLYWFNPPQFSMCCRIILTTSVFYFNNILYVYMNSRAQNISAEFGLKHRSAFTGLSSFLMHMERTKGRAEPTPGRGLHTVLIFFIQHSSLT